MSDLFYSGRVYSPEESMCDIEKITMTEAVEFFGKFVNRRAKYYLVAMSKGDPRSQFPS